MGLATFASGVSLGLSLSLFGLEDSYSKRKDARAGRDAEVCMDTREPGILRYRVWLDLSSFPWALNKLFCHPVALSPELAGS